uniref:Reverse transcriptase zinc-binding domain-containing protein n=1 Tax=Fagus sylvatica TaxID=28930 RepID=A0A2N9HQK9_FAGSY
MAEEAILGYLANNEEIADSGEFAAQHGLNHDDVVNVIKSLSGFKYVDSQDIKRETWVPTDEGNMYAASGSPEVQLFLAIPPEGIPREELQKKLDPLLFKIGCAQAAKNKWVEMGKQLVSRKVEHVDDKVKNLLLQIKEGQVVDQDDIKALKGRKLIAPQTWNGFSLKKGPDYAPQRRKVAADLTREMLQSSAAYLISCIMTSLPVKFNLELVNTIREWWIVSMVVKGGAGAQIRLEHHMGIKFWKDSWCGDQPLQTRFPELFRLACDPNAMVDTHLRFHDATHVWDIEFYRPFQDWEVERGVSFMELLYSLPIRRGTMDSIWWQPSTKGIFEVRSYYSVLVQSSDTYFPWKRVWNSKVPSRVAFFIWTVALGRILTTDNLRRRRILILDWCCMCQSDGESVNHLLLHCRVAQELWNMILNMFGVSWVMPRDVVDLLSCWSGNVGKGDAGVIWRVIPHCLMWCLWGERNARTFVEELEGYTTLSNVVFMG